MDQTGSSAHPVPNPRVAMGDFPGIKNVVVQLTSLVCVSAKVENTWSYPSTLSTHRHVFYRDKRVVLKRELFVNELHLTCECSFR